MVSIKLVTRFIDRYHNIYSLLTDTLRLVTDSLTVVSIKLVTRFIDRYRYIWSIIITFGPLSLHLVHDSLLILLFILYIASTIQLFPILFLVRHT